MPHWRQRGELCREFAIPAKHHLEVDARVGSKPTQEVQEKDGRAAPRGVVRDEEHPSLD
jgi:hypothetical protein